MIVPIPEELNTEVLIEFLETYARATAEAGKIATVELLINDISEEELKNETGAMTRHDD